MKIVILCRSLFFLAILFFYTTTYPIKCSSELTVTCLDGHKAKSPCTDWFFWGCIPDGIDPHSHSSRKNAIEEKLTELCRGHAASPGAVAGWYDNSVKGCK